MALPYSFIGDGYYTSTATALNIPLSDQPTFFQVTDTTLWGANNSTDYTAAANIQSNWDASMPAGYYLQLGQAASALGAASIYATQGTSGGFTFVDQTNPPTYTKVAITNVNATTFVVLTGTTTGVNVGDLVRLVNVSSTATPGEGREISGSPFVFQVTAVNAGVSITLGYAATAVSNGLSLTAIGAGTGYYQKVYPGFMYPKLQSVAYVTQATNAKVYFFRQNDFTPGELVDFQIPTPYGMTQLSNLTANAGSGALSTMPSGAARVLTVTNSATESSIVIDVNTTGFPAFVYPSGVNYTLGASPPVCFPAGSGVVPLNGSATLVQSPPGTNLLDAFDNKAQYVMNLGTNVVGANASVMYWVAYKGDYFNGITNA